MELLIALVASAALVGLYAVWKSIWDSHKQLEQSLRDHHARMAERAKSDREAIRVFVKLSEVCQVTGWGPCQRVSVPAGEYIAYATKVQHDPTHGPEESICLIDVPQVWRGEAMKRDVFVRAADYPFFNGFPEVVDTQYIQVLSKKPER